VTDFRLDGERAARTGIAEAVLCEHKSAAQIVAIAAAVIGAEERMLFTRLKPEMFAKLPADLRGSLDYDAVSGTAFLGAAGDMPIDGIGIVAAGTSDLPVAREAARTLAFHGYAAPLTADIGVAGLWRLTTQLDALRRHRIIIAVAGMEGALFSVLAGLVEAPVIAVASSVGYGVAAGGRLALDVALASCAPGIVAVNIDNGFGAAAAAIKILRSVAR
jgi:pyridinium-3,5-biscarboxylic acid mononucleotide synthase